MEWRKSFLYIILHLIPAKPKPRKDTSVYIYIYIYRWVHLIKYNSTIICVIKRSFEADRYVCPKNLK